MFTKNLALNKGITYSFALQPKKLAFDNKLLINQEVYAILEKHNIELKLEIYESKFLEFDKPKLILLHGNSSSKQVFAEHIKRYSKDYHVIAIDLLGHGGSSKINNLEQLTNDEKNTLSEAFYNPCAMVAELKQFLEKKDIQNAHFVGWSLGGHLAYALAVENPKLVSSIVAIGSPPVMFSTKGFAQGFGEWFVNTLLPNWVNDPKPIPIEQATFIRDNMGFKKEDEFFIEDLVKADPHMRRHLFLKLSEYDEQAYKGTGLDGENFAKNTNIPLCLIVVEEDMGINASSINAFKDKLMNKASQVHIIEGSHHAVWNTNPEHYYEAVGAFIGLSEQLKQKQQTEVQSIISNFI